MTFYDVFRANRGGRKHRCGVCYQDSFYVWTLSRGPDDDEIHDGGVEEINACERCLTDAMLDGIAP